MPPYNNQMYQGGMTPPGGMPQGPMGGINPQALQQYLQSQQNQQGPMQQPPMQSATPDQGMNQAPQPPPGWGGLPPGVGNAMQGYSGLQGGGNGYSPGMSPGYNGGRPFTPGEGFSQEGRGRGPFPGGSGPFMPPGMGGQPMPKPNLGGGLLYPQPGGQMPPQAPQPRQPPAPRLPPNAGVYRMNGQTMNQTPIFSGQVNPNTVKQPGPPTPQTGGVLTSPAGPATDLPSEPIKVAPPMPAAPIKGAPPFNPEPGGGRIRATTQTPPIKPEPQGFAATPKPEVNRQKLKGQLAARKFTSASAK